MNRREPSSVSSNSLQRLTSTKGHSELGAQSYLTYGPYVTAFATGEHTALWTMLIDNNVGDEGPVVRLEVYDTRRAK